jgi:hypothetical protein
MPDPFHASGLSLSSSRTVIFLGLLASVVVMIVSACAVPSSSTMQSSVQQPITQVQLPYEWPDEIPSPDGYTLEYAVGGPADGRSDFVAQYVAFRDRSATTQEYVETLIAEGFALVEHAPELGIWTLKGFGMQVEVVIDTSHPGLTWMALSISEP